MITKEPTGASCIQLQLSAGSGHRDEDVSKDGDDESFGRTNILLLTLRSFPTTYDSTKLPHH